MSTSPAYYVRSRGQTDGPFDISALRQLVRQGKVSRFDHLSADASTWWPAGDLPGLFVAQQPSRSGAKLAIADAADTVSGIPLSDEASGAASRASEANRFFYSHRGAVAGPVTLAQLKMLAAGGTLAANDQVWADGSDISTPAKHVPMLAEAYGIAPHDANTPHASPRERGATRPVQREDLDTRSHLVADTQMVAKVIYVVAGGATVLFSLFPVTIFDGKPYWWWDAGLWPILWSVYVMIAALALVVLAPLTERLARPLVALTLIAMPLLAAFIVALIRSLLVDALAPLATIAVWGCCVLPVIVAAQNRSRQRLRDGGPASIRIQQGFAGLLLLNAALSGIASLIILLTHRQFPSGGPLLAAYLMCWVGVLANLAGGVLAVVAAIKTRFTPALCVASTITILIAPAVFILAVGIVVTDVRIRPFIGANRLAVTYAVSRGLILAVAAIAWFNMSVRELLTWIYRREMVDAR